MRNKAALKLSSLVCAFSVGVFTHGFAQSTSAVPDGLLGHLHCGARVRIFAGVQIPIPEWEIAAGDLQSHAVPL